MSTQLDIINDVPTPEDEILSRADALLAAMWPLESPQADTLVFRSGLMAPWVDACPGLQTNISLWGVYNDALDYVVSQWLRTLQDPQYKDICSRLLEIYP